MNNKRKKVLVADDDFAILDAVSMMLEDEGYEVVTTAEGETIYKIENDFPDLLLLDIWMSGIDGRDVCMKLKSQEQTKHIPIILFSANKDTKIIAKESGADDFIIKPFEMRHLLDKVSKYVNAEK
jgi:DNA-binding response OmpR family regulator